ncbi:MAG: pantetheine-phosphate adenylyltransferase [Ruminococcaceae bacterium]|nr:pantetheine-phosphate adenylyltransferase [Oscillospiraceae bacterium]
MGAEERSPRIAICPGSYDPVTFGHLNIIERAAAIFDKVVVVVSTNTDKRSTFTPAERADMLRKVTAGMPNVAVDIHEGLVAEYAKTQGACTLVKGLRAVTDFEYEFQMALINQKLNPELETIFVTTDMRFMYLSSSAVREIAKYGGDLSDFVPPEIMGTIAERYHNHPSFTERSKGYDD